MARGSTTLRRWTLALLAGSMLAAAAAQPAALTRIMQEQLLSYFGTVDFTLYAFQDDESVAYNQFGIGGAAFAYNLGSARYTFREATSACEYGDNFGSDAIGPFTGEAISRQMQALAPVAARLLGNLCTANVTCAAALAPLVPAGQTPQQAIGSWTAAQAAAWHDGFTSTFSYNPLAEYCPRRLNNGVFALLSSAPKGPGSRFGIEHWQVRAAMAAAGAGTATCSATAKTAGPTYDRLHALSRYVLPPWLVLAERLVRDLIMHNAPHDLADPAPYNLALNPGLATASYGASAGRRQLLKASPAPSTAAAAAAARGLLQDRRLAAASDCSAAITAKALELQMYADACAVAAASISKAVTAQEGAAAPGAPSNVARMGLGLLSDALAACPAGLCTSRNVTFATAALAQTRASMAPGAASADDLSWTELITSTCGLAQLAAQAMRDAASCCGANCDRTAGCSNARLGIIKLKFPDASYGGVAGSSIC